MFDEFTTLLVIVFGTIFFVAAMLYAEQVMLSQV